ncbi:MAG: superoxide dismutase [Acidimicrobiales bacterium]
MNVYTLPDLPYDHGALEPAISGSIIELHHDKHHAAYVLGANRVSDQLAEARASGSYDGIVGLEKTLAFHLSGHALHSIYWTNLSPDGGGEPDGVLAEAIDRDFGGFEQFRAHLTAVTNGVQGSGWGALSYDSLSKRLMVEQIQDHQANHSPSTTPLLVFDIWEHAFYLQYRNVKADYVDALWTIVNWDNVVDRFVAASSR